jgi:hypothetical protein
VAVTHIFLPTFGAKIHVFFHLAIRFDADGGAVECKPKSNMGYIEGQWMLFLNVCLQENNCLAVGKQLFDYRQIWQESIDCPSMNIEKDVKGAYIAPRTDINGRMLQ